MWNSIHYIQFPLEIWASNRQLFFNIRFLLFETRVFLFPSAESCGSYSAMILVCEVVMPAAGGDRLLRVHLQGFLELLLRLFNSIFNSIDAGCAGPRAPIRWRDGAWTCVLGWVKPNCTTQRNCSACLRSEHNSRRSDYRGRDIMTSYWIE